MLICIIFFLFACLITIGVFVSNKDKASKASMEADKFLRDVKHDQSYLKFLNNSVVLLKKRLYIKGSATIGPTGKLLQKQLKETHCGVAAERKYQPELE